MGEPHTGVIVSDGAFDMRIVFAIGSKLVFIIGSWLKTDYANFISIARLWSQQVSGEDWMLGIDTVTAQLHQTVDHGPWIQHIQGHVLFVRKDT